MVNTWIIKKTFVFFTENCSRKTEVTSRKTEVASSFFIIENSDFVKKSNLFSFFSKFTQFLPCSNVFHLFVGCFPGSWSPKVHSFHSWLLCFSTLENSQLTGGKHFLTAKFRKVWKKMRTKYYFFIVHWIFMSK